MTSSTIVIESHTYLLPRANIDTDQIIPSRHLTARSQEEFRRGLFAYWRDDPGFPIRETPDPHRRILLAGDNFGCGSSREAAVWALQAGGIDVVISTSFADIFRRNALVNGLIPIVIDQAAFHEAEAVIARDPDGLAYVDVAEQTVWFGDGAGPYPFPLEPFYRERFLEGEDELTYLLHRDADIERYELSGANFAQPRTIAEVVAEWRARDA